MQNNNQPHKKDKKVIGTFDQIICKEQYSRTEHPLIRKIANKNVKRKVQDNNQKSAQKRFTEMKPPCQPNCQCRACIIQNRFKRQKHPQNMDQILWSGLLVINPNTASYSMEKSCLTYRQIVNISLNSSLTKIKYFMDKQLCIPLIKITTAQNQEKFQTILFANRKESINLYIKTILAYLTINHRYDVQYKARQSFEGYLYKKYSIHGNWQRKFMKVQKSKLKDQNNQLIQSKSPCLWTSFQIVDLEIPHMVLKIWDGIWKVQYGLPIDRLSEWLTPFLSLIQVP